MLDKDIFDEIDIQTEQALMYFFSSELPRHVGREWKDAIADLPYTDSEFEILRAEGVKDSLRLSLDMLFTFDDGRQLMFENLSYGRLTYDKKLALQNIEVVEHENFAAYEKWRKEHVNEYEERIFYYSIGHTFNDDPSGAEVTFHLGGSGDTFWSDYQKELNKLVNVDTLSDEQKVKVATYMTFQRITYNLPEVFHVGVFDVKVDWVDDPRLNTKVPKTIRYDGLIYKFDIMFEDN